MEVHENKSTQGWHKRHDVTVIISATFKMCFSNSNEVFLRATNHTGQAEKNLLGPAGIRTRDLRFTSP